MFFLKKVVGNVGKNKLEQANGYLVSTALVPRPVSVK
jgi:hypothetical protein